MSVNYHGSATYTEVEQRGITEHPIVRGRADNQVFGTRAWKITRRRNRLHNDTECSRPSQWLKDPQVVARVGSGHDPRWCPANSKE
jgi:hypothetical protein